MRPLEVHRGEILFRPTPPSKEVEDLLLICVAEHHQGLIIPDGGYTPKPVMTVDWNPVATLFGREIIFMHFTYNVE